TTRQMASVRTIDAPSESPVIPPNRLREKAAVPTAHVPAAISSHHPCRGASAADKAIPTAAPTAARRAPPATSERASPEPGRAYGSDAAINGATARDRLNATAISATRRAVIRAA